MKKRIGVLGLQGDFARHLAILDGLGAEAVDVRDSAGLDSLDGLVIPGGESTTIGKLMVRFKLLEPIRARASAGLPVFGTCAGAILLAKEIEDSDQVRLGLIDMSVVRNAYGRQIESFEADIEVPPCGADPVRGIFIRAPVISRVAEGVEVLASFEGLPVLVRSGLILAATFHPEITGDGRIHDYFLAIT